MKSFTSSRPCGRRSSAVASSAAAVSSDALASSVARTPRELRREIAQHHRRRAAEVLAHRRDRRRVAHVADEAGDVRRRERRDRRRGRCRRHGRGRRHARRRPASTPRAMRPDRRPGRRARAAGNGRRAGSACRRYGPGSPQPSRAGRVRPYDRTTRARDLRHDRVPGPVSGSAGRSAACRWPAAAARCTGWAPGPARTTDTGSGVSKALYVGS